MLGTLVFVNESVFPSHADFESGIGKVDEARGNRIATRMSLEIVDNWRETEKVHCSRRGCGRVHLGHRDFPGRDMLSRNSIWWKLWFKRCSVSSV